jgi:hypothetical protein
MRTVAQLHQEAPSQVAVICICGCGRTFPAGKHGRKYFDTRSGSACRKKVWESRWLRTRPAKRNTGSLVPFERLPRRVYTRRFVEPGSIRNALALVAHTNPEVFLKLVNSISVAETPARARIELAG